MSPREEDPPEATSKIERFSEADFELAVDRGIRILKRTGLFDGMKSDFVRSLSRDIVRQSGLVREIEVRDDVIHDLRKRERQLLEDRQTLSDLMRRR